MNVHKQWNHLLSSLLLVAAFRKRNALRRQIQTQTYLIKISMTAILIGFGDFVYDKPSEFFVHNKKKSPGHLGGSLSVATSLKTPSDISHLIHLLSLDFKSNNNNNNNNIYTCL